MEIEGAGRYLKTGFCLASCTGKKEKEKKSSWMSCAKTLLLTFFTETDFYRLPSLPLLPILYIEEKMQAVSAVIIASVQSLYLGPANAPN